MRLQPKGFTLVELIMVMVIVGIMAVFAVPRFMDKSIQERGFRDAAKAAIGHARHVAVAARRYTCVNVTTGSGAAAIVDLSMVTIPPESLTTVVCPAAAAVNLPSPVGGCATNQVCASSGISIASVTVNPMIFDPQGRLVDSSKTVVSNAALTVTNQAPINIAGETGFVQ